VLFCVVRLKGKTYAMGRAEVGAVQSFVGVVKRISSTGYTVLFAIFAWAPITHAAEARHTSRIGR
jgi:hypothetical protein